MNIDYQSKLWSIINRYTLLNWRIDKIPTKSQSNNDNKSDNWYHTLKCSDNWCIVYIFEFLNLSRIAAVCTSFTITYNKTLYNENKENFSISQKKFKNSEKKQ